LNENKIIHNNVADDYNMIVNNVVEYISNNIECNGVCNNSEDKETTNVIRQ